MDRAVGLKYYQQPSESYYSIRKLVASTLANMISRAFDFNISYDPTKIQPNKEFIMEIATPIFNVIKRNPETPFSINVDYKGLPASTSTEVISQYEPRISQLSVDCFLSWTKSAYNYTVSEEDKRKLREGKDKALSKQALEYYRIFTDSVWSTTLLCSNQLTLQSIPNYT